MKKLMMMIVLTGMMLVQGCKDEVVEVVESQFKLGSIDWELPALIDTENMRDPSQIVVVPSDIEIRQLERQRSRDNEAFLSEMDADFQDYLSRREQVTPEQREKEDAIMLGGFIEMEDIMDLHPESVYMIRLQLRIDLMRIALR